MKDWLVGIMGTLIYFYPYHRAIQARAAERKNFSYVGDANYQSHSTCQNDRDIELH